MTTFDTWLATLASAGKLLPADQFPIATRGLAWSNPIELAGNWTGATLTGSISAAPDAASALVAFTIGALSYNATDDVTVWQASLASGTGSNSTGALPSDSNGDGVEALPCAFYLTPSGGANEMLFGTAFRVAGRV